MSISNSMSKALPEAERVRKWAPELGHVYYLPNSNQHPNARSAAAKAESASKDGTPMPDGNAPAGKAATASTNAAADPITDDASLERSVEEAFMVHMLYGGEYVDENPITGRPGEFHLSSTGRKPVVSQLSQQPTGISAMNGPSAKSAGDDKKDGSTSSGKDKSKSGGQPKLKRRKSKVNKSAATTPAAS